MNKLFVLRHAKAGQHTSQDHDRPLTDVGHEQARQLGVWFREQGITFDAVLVSSSLRTVETVEGLGLGGGFTIVPRLYSAPASVLESVIRECGLESGSLLIVGHNPGVSDLASEAGNEGSLSTCTVVEISVPASFADFSAGTSTATGSFRPAV